MEVVTSANLLAGGALLRVVLLVAGHANDVHVARDEALVADGLLALEAQEARLVPLLALVLELLHARLEHLLAPAAAAQHTPLVDKYEYYYCITLSVCTSGHLNKSRQTQKNSFTSRLQCSASRP